MATASGAVGRGALWLLLGGWIGAWATFGLLVAPAVFRGAPGAAGEVVGPVLAGLHLYGGGAGILLSLLAFLRGRGALLIALPLVMSALCFVSHFGVSAELAEIGEQALGADGSQDLAARFNRLHRLSLTLYVGVGFGALALLGLHARADAREARAA